MNPASDRQSSSTRTARRLERARRRLLDAGAAIIAEKGASSLRLREITDRADIAFGSFYTHFATKEELVAAVAIDTVESLAASIIGKARQIPDPAEAAAVGHRWFIRLATDQPDIARLVVNLDRADARLEQTVGLAARAAMARGFEAGRFSALNVDVALAFLFGGTIAVMRGVLEGRLTADADEASAEELLRFLGVPPSEAAVIAHRPFPADDPPADDRRVDESL